VIEPDACMKWLEQCRVTTTIKERYGLRSAFDYLVSEKLLDFARAAERDPELARQLPRFVSEVRRIFEADDLRVQLARVEREQEAQELVSHDEETFDEDEVFRDDHGISAARARSFMLIKQLLLAPLRPPPRRACAGWSAYFNLMTFVDVASAVSVRAALRRKPGETFHWRRSSVMNVTVRLL